jgi:hypothetical protein
MTDIKTLQAEVSRLENEKAALIWALHFFALMGKDIDNYQDASRGAWLWSELFAYRENKDGEFEIDDEPAIKERLDDDLNLLGINHEYAGGCYSYGLPVKLFRRAGELLSHVGDINQYDTDQKELFKHWLWNGGAIPSLKASSD